MAWINAAEVFRYFVMVRPALQAAFPHMPGVGQMNLGIFAIWGIWDTILVFAATGSVWLFLDRFGGGVRQAITAGILFWMSIFVILWLGVYNMGLATLSILAVALPGALIEQVIASLVVNWGRQRFAT